MYIEGENMAKKITAAGLPIGGPSLLMVFVLVCINIFAAISYTSALRDYKLSEKTAENITQYYSAEVKASPSKPKTPPAKTYTYKVPA